MFKTIKSRAPKVFAACILSLIVVMMVSTRASDPLIAGHDVLTRPTLATPEAVVVAPTATVAPTAVIVEPVAPELPRAIADMAAPEVVTPTEAPAAEAAPAPPVVDAPVASSNESAPCAAGQLKGNDNSHIFHAPGQLAYARTHASVTCFDTAAQATAAGYRAAKR